MTKYKKRVLMLTCVLVLSMLFGTTAFAAGTGDVAGAIEGTWRDASGQIKTVVNNVVFPAIDLILAVFFFGDETAFFAARPLCTLAFFFSAILYVPRFLCK